MPIVSIAIGKSKYQIDCADGEEEKIKKLADKLNARVNNLSMAIRNADEKTILVLCGIIAEEELENAKLNIDEEKIEDAKEESITEDDVYNAVAENMENIATHINKVISKIKDL